MSGWSCFTEKGKIKKETVNASKVDMNQQMIPQPVLPTAPAQAAPEPLLAFFLAVQVSEGP